ncbi:MAG: hypothetical protein M5U11_00840 [Anaerolineales bacterium]|nr:hypothetical protein [Anaerolineales bacterium]
MSDEVRTVSNYRFSDLPKIVDSAEEYRYCDDIWVVTCYFNSPGYQTKFNNFLKFESNFRKAGINLVTIECAFGNSDFALYESPNTLRIRSQDVMWQKERLINVAIAKLPQYVRKVAWVDCDILFSNPNWLVETSKLLEKYPVVQPFQTAIRLPQGCDRYCGQGEIWESFGYAINNAQDAIFKGDFQLHGHTGFAWAAQRNVVENNGLYDAFLSGSGDHFMAHAMCGDFVSYCYDNLPMSEQHKSHFLKWAKQFHCDVRGRVGWLPGEVLHLWHGDRVNRNYTQRAVELANFDFDPLLDLVTGNNGAWQWKSNKPRLHNWALEYFYQRKEDGDT